LARTVARARYGIDASVVPNGVDVRRFAAVAPAKRLALRHERNFGTRPVFLTIGGIEARKNTLGLLEAFARVRAARPGALLIIAGGASVFDHGTYRRAFEARRAELALGDDAVSVVGAVADAEIVALLRAADVFAFPSLVEGFGLVVLEALACATPVVTSALAPFDEYLSNDAALLVDPRDPSALATGMLRALQPHVRRRLRANGTNVADSFSWSASARAHIARYRAPFETAV
jgi:glycosyltransferase-like protein